MGAYEKGKRKGDTASVSEGRKVGSCSVHEGRELWLVRVEPTGRVSVDGRVTNGAGGPLREVFTLQGVTEACRGPRRAAEGHGHGQGCYSGGGVRLRREAGAQGGSPGERQATAAQRRSSEPSGTNVIVHRDTK